MMKTLIVLMITLPVMAFSQAEGINGSQSQDTLKRPAAVNKDSAAFYFARAHTFNDQGKTREAMNDFRRACEFYPASEEAFLGWFSLSTQLYGVYESAKVFEEWIMFWPENPVAWGYKGMFEAETGHPEEALKSFEREAELEPGISEAEIGIGQMLYALGRYNEALEEFNKSLEAFPERTDLWGMKAGALARMGRYDEALAAIGKALDLAPEEATSLYNRACIYSIKGDRDNALNDLKKAISHDASLKENARKDEDFRNLYEDEDFKNLTR